MAGKIIKVTTQELKTAAKNLHDLAGHYQDKYNEFYRITGEMAANWSGEDNLAFINRIDGFKDNFRTMYNEIEDYSEFLKKAAAAYEATQDNIKKQAENLRN